MTAFNRCFVCGRFGRKMGHMRAYECKRCLVMFGPPVPMYLPDPGTTTHYWLVIKEQKLIDHAKEYAPCP